MLLGALALIWGSSFILIKRGLTAFTASQVGALRIFAAFAVFLPVALWTLGRLPRGKWGYALLSGLLGSLIPSFLFATAGTRLDSAISGTLNALTPMCTLLVGTAFFGQRLTPSRTLGLLLGLAGCAALTLVNARGDLSFGNSYVLLVLVATLCYGFNLNLIKQYLGGLNPLHLASWALLGVGPVAGAYLFSTDFVQRLRPEVLPTLGYVLTLGIVGTATANVLFNKVIQLSTPVFASSVTYLIPVVAVAWGVFDGERLLLSHYLGLAAILLGVYIVNRKQ